MRAGLKVIVDLCKVGRRELLMRWVNNQLTWREAWSAAMGAAECIREIAEKGDDALLDDEAAAARLNVCASCPSRTMGATGQVTEPGGSVERVRAWYCGQALQPQKDGPTPTCGCLLGIERVREEAVDGDGGGGTRTVSLEVLPRCAGQLKDKPCWQGKW